jgi:hypothetical protein
MSASKTGSYVGQHFELYPLWNCSCSISAGRMDQAAGTGPDQCPVALPELRSMVLNWQAAATSDQGVGAHKDSGLGAAARRHSNLPIRVSYKPGADTLDRFRFFGGAQSLPQSYPNSSC